jgi:hypothetical protein
MAERRELKVGYRVRRKSDGAPGTIEDFMNEQMSLVLWDGQKDTFKCDVADLEKLPLTEMQLLSAYREASELCTKLNSDLETAKSDKARAGDELIKFLEDHGKDATAVYEGIGRAEISGSEVYASITEANRDKAFEEIKTLGRGDVIKETIHPKTLSTFVGELIQNGKKVPDGISYILKAKLSLRKK